MEIKTAEFGTIKVGWHISTCSIGFKTYLVAQTDANKREGQ